MDPSETNDPTSIWAHVEACRELIKDRCQRLLTKTLHDDITEEKAAEEIHARILEGVKHYYAALGVGDGVPEGNSAKQLALHSFLAFLASCGEEIRKSTTNANKAGFRGWEEHACGILRHLIDPLNLKVLTRSATDFLKEEKFPAGHEFAMAHFYELGIINEASALSVYAKNPGRWQLFKECLQDRAKETSPK